MSYIKQHKEPTALIKPIHTACVFHFLFSRSCSFGETDNSEYV